MESAHLIGPEHLGPTLEQQLDFSSRGAHLTVAVPVARLSAFIEKLGISEGQPTTLRILPPRAGDVADNSETLPASSSLTAWIAEGSAVRESIARLEQSRPDALVLVPVPFAEIRWTLRYIDHRADQDPLGVEIEDEKQAYVQFHFSY